MKPTIVVGALAFTLFVTSIATAQEFTLPAGAEHLYSIPTDTVSGHHLAHHHAPLVTNTEEGWAHNGGVAVRSR